MALDSIEDQDGTYLDNSHNQTGEVSTAGDADSPPRDVPLAAEQSAGDADTSIEHNVTPPPSTSAEDDMDTENV